MLRRLLLHNYISKSTFIDVNVNLLVFLQPITKEALKVIETIIIVIIT